MKNPLAVKMMVYWENPGIKRLVVSVSLIWGLFFYVLSEKDEQYQQFLLFGLLPVISLWLIIWTVKGFNNHKKIEESKRKKIHFPRRDK